MGAQEKLCQVQFQGHHNDKIQADILSTSLLVHPEAMTEFEKTLTAQGTEGCRQFLDSGISKYAHPELCVSRALIMALGKGHSSIAEILLERSTPEGERMAYEMWGVTPLHIAVASNNEAMVELLLMSNACPERRLRPDLFRVISMLACLGERRGVFDQLYHQYLGLPIPTPLGIAVERGHRSQVDALIRRYKNGYLLHVLVWSKRDTWLRELLPDYLDNVNQPDETGSTPLHIAVMVKSVPCIDLLLSAHADGTLLNLDGLSPAHMAIEEQPDIGVFERLMESIDRANMAKLSRSLLTSVLDHASPSQDLVIALLDRGASIDGIPSRDWWRAFGPPEKDNDSHHIHISRSMKQTYSIHRCSNANLDVLDLPPYFCQAHREINMLLLPKSCINPSFRSRLDPLHALGPLSFRVFNHDTWERKAILPQLTHLARLPPNKFFITFSISIECPEGLQDETLANAKETPPRGQFIGWVFTRADTERNDATRVAKPCELGLRLVTYFSTLDCGWIPESPAELCICLLDEMASDWHMVYEQSLQYLNRMRIKILQQEGRNKTIIRDLLRASLECSHFVNALQLQVHRIMSQIEVYQTHDYLRDSLHDDSDSALENISRSTKQLEKNVKKKISELSQLTQDLITLEFNLVSIHEAQLSTSMSISMKRLSWITFIYLPLTFAASVFGANINVLADNPGWWWMAVLAGALLFTTFSGWILFKYTELENHLETAGDGIYSTIVNRFGGRNRTDREQGIKDALE